jgi:HK97 gp10 family phage protein
MAKIRLEDHSEPIRKAIKEETARALKKAAMMVEGRAILRSPTDGGNLRSSITHEVISDDTAIVGTNVEYAAYLEFGTGIYAEDGKGRKTPWSYEDKDGNWVTTRGMKPQPYLRPAFDESKKDIKEILSQAIDDGVRRGAK